MPHGFQYLQASAQCRRRHRKGTHTPHLFLSMRTECTCTPRRPSRRSCCRGVAGGEGLLSTCNTSSSCAREQINADLLHVPPYMCWIHHLFSACQNCKTVQLDSSSRACYTVLRRNRHYPLSIHEAFGRTSRNSVSPPHRAIITPTLATHTMQSTLKNVRRGAMMIRSYTRWSKLCRFYQFYGQPYRPL